MEFEYDDRFDKFDKDDTKLLDSVRTPAPSTHPAHPTARHAVPRAARLNAGISHFLAARPHAPSVSQAGQQRARSNVDIASHLGDEAGMSRLGQQPSPLKLYPSSSSGTSGRFIDTKLSPNPYVPDAITH